jgi:hypothetical protein
MPGPIVHHFLRFAARVASARPGGNSPSEEEAPARHGPNPSAADIISVGLSVHPNDACMPGGLEGRSLEVEWGVRFAPWSRRRI